MNRNHYRWQCLGLVVTLAAALLVAGPSVADETSVFTPISVHDGLKLFGKPVHRPTGPIWLRGEYLLWWTNGTHLQPLVTTSPTGTPSVEAGVLPGATILFGESRQLSDARSGYRLESGMWLDQCRQWDVRLDYYSLGARESGFQRTSTGDPILARPFYNVETAQQASLLIAYPGLRQGSVAVEAADYFQSAGFLVGHRLWGDGDEDPTANPFAPSYLARLDLIGGFRYYNLSDRLGIVTVSTVTEAGPLQDVVFQIRDAFRARNDFYGADLGFRGRIHRGRWTLDLLGKMAIGSTSQTVYVDGRTAVAAPSQPTQVYQAGALAVDTNGGVFRRNMFTIVPQASIELGYQFNANMRVFLGYEALYWARVVRAADQIDLDIDPRNFPPPVAGATHFPQPGRCTNYFWAQGLNVGAEWRF